MNIPIHFYVIHDGDGTPPFQFQSIDNSIQVLNSSLAGSNLCFYKCREDHLVSAAYFDISFSSGLEADALYNEHHDNESLNVYIVGSILGQVPKFYTTVPSDPDPVRAIFITPIPGSSWPPTFLAYALGIHSGLLNTTTLAFPTNGNCPIDPSLPCLGDGICDTPVDPGVAFATCANPVYTTTCIDAMGQSRTYTYTPDLFNVMAWSRACGATGFHFSPEQIQVLEAFANIHFDFTPDPCQTTFIPVLGNVSRTCSPFGPSWEGIEDMGINFENYSFGTNSSNSLLPATAPSGDYPMRLCVFTPDDDILLAPFKSAFGSYHPDVINPLNGLTTNDLVLLSRHILGITPLEYSSQFFAGDVNYSGSITTFDIVTIRKVILGIIDNFQPNVGSWRFIPQYYLHSNPQFESDIFSVPNPFGLTWTDPLSQLPNKTYTSGTNSFMDQLDFDLSGNPFAADQETYSFWAIKSGDINCTAEPNFEGEDGEEYVLTYPSAPVTISQNQYFDISFMVNSSAPLTGYQFAFNFDPAAIQVISPQPGETQGFSSDNFGLTHLAEGKLTTLWYQDDGAARSFSANINVFKLRCRALQPINNWTDVIQMEADSIFNNAFENAAAVEVPANISIQINPVTPSFRGGKYLDAVFYPNIFTENVNLQVTSGLPGTAVITFVDAFGNSASKDILIEEGVNNIQFDSITNLNPGLISYRIDMNGEIASGKLIKQFPR